MSLITKELLNNITRNRKANLSKGLGAAMILNEHFSIDKTYDIFLSHSYLDKDQIASLKYFLEEFGFSVYIDWIDDSQLNRNSVTKETAVRIRERMRHCKSLLFAFSENSSNSKWMPWELGYFDGLKGTVAIIPITTAIKNSFEGTEYVGLYPYVTKDLINGKDKETLWVREHQNNYIMMSNWVNGQNHFKDL